ncbi:spore germination protein GerPC [Paenibacillus sp. 1P07SE]|uniref:spore germination protein GerPC n=1 Tax=Paenibacillus sp. 1P07SE TaxID=3132209 RepID=UPI0039A6E758
MQQQPFSWQDWARQTQHQVQQQAKRIAELERQMCELSARLACMDEKPSYTIERLEYHFDQLKVDRLEGTLHIGMTPPAGESLGEMDQFTVTPAYPQPPGSPSAAAPSSQTVEPALGPPDDELRQRIDHYLAHAAPALLSELAAQRQLPIDPHHARLILDDLKRQALPRLAYYRETARRDSSGTAAADDIAARTIRDIEEAMRVYITRLGQGEDPS